MVFFRGYILDYKRGTSNIDNNHAKKTREREHQTRNPSEYFIEVNMNVRRMVAWYVTGEKCKTPRIKG